MTTEIIDADGNKRVIYDPDKMFFRFFQIEADNFPAYISAHKHVISWAVHIRNTCNSKAGSEIADFMIDLTMNNMISLTGTSSKDGALIKALLLDKQESIVKMESSPGKQSIMDTIKNNTGQSNPMGHQEPNY